VNPADERMAEAFGVQIGVCEGGAPFTADLLRALLRDFEAGGDWRRRLGDWPVDPEMDAAPLRAAGALHRLALKGEAPFAGLFERLDRDPHALDGAVRAAGRRPDVAEWLNNPPQTNEVMRSAVLLPGFFEIARAQGLPLRLREMGCSGGLNLLWDRYRFRLGETDWGDPASPVRLEPRWEGASPEPVDLKVHSRRGCDQLPMDLADPEARYRLLSYIWADQADRVTRVRGALTLAQADPPEVDRASAVDWVEAQIEALPAGTTTVLYHSYVWHYLDPPAKARVGAAMARAGGRANDDAGLAWLAFESEGGTETPFLTLKLWPGDGAPRRLAEAHPHGRWIKRLGGWPLAPAEE
jgi:hypothetical protein